MYYVTFKDEDSLKAFHRCIKRHKGIMVTEVQKREGRKNKVDELVKKLVGNPKQYYDVHLLSVFLGTDGRTTKRIMRDAVVMFPDKVFYEVCDKAPRGRIGIISGSQQGINIFKSLQEEIKNSKN